ncbi:MAG: Cof-type HAD-IIB family hydrolase [Dysgonamonadaceae bacterium]|jgi:Cof subfamily protein (haloacid dehalogenase superfamily)|nr:Cof-type HAD-IIB family hydrolase [Dysgonamonadaceae bacterium]
MKYKLLALDLDGTLLRSDNTISPATLNALIKIQSAGVKIALVSGRPTFGLKYAEEKLELANYGGYSISYNGSRIKDLKDEGLIFDKRIDPGLFPLLQKEADKQGLTLFTYDRNKIYTNHPDDPHVLKEAEICNMDVVKVDDFADEISFSPCKCIIVSDDADTITELERKWKRRLDGVSNVFSSEPFFLEFVPQHVDKANTLSFLLDRMAITREEVVAIGDGNLDFSMIQLAGFGIAMGNAKDSIKSCADFVTDTNDNDGVAKAIGKLVEAGGQPTQIPAEVLNAQTQNSLMGNLGIRYTYISDKQVVATMPVDKRTRQPFGLLHGGATLALAETIAGVGSMVLCEPGDHVVGMQVSGNHVSSAHEGDTVRGVGTLIHKGRSSHVWNVDIFTSTDKLISSVRVTNGVVKK